MQPSSRSWETLAMMIQTMEGSTRPCCSQHKRHRIAHHRNHLHPMQRSSFHSFLESRKSYRKLIDWQVTITRETRTVMEIIIVMQRQMVGTIELRPVVELNLPLVALLASIRPCQSSRVLTWTSFRPWVIKESHQQTSDQSQRMFYLQMTMTLLIL